MLVMGCRNWPARIFGQGRLKLGRLGAQLDCFVRTQTGMAGGGDHWQPALLDLRYRRSHQSGARTHDDKISGSGKRKGLVAKTLGKTFVAVFQLQCSRKSPSFAVSKLMKNQFENEVLLHGYG